VSLPVKRTSPFIQKTLNHPCFDLPDIQEPPPWYLSTSSHEAAARSRTRLSRSEGRRGSLGVGDVGPNKTVRKRETPVRNPSRSRIVASHKSHDKSRENTRYTRACVCVLLLILNHLKYSTRASHICWSSSP
jgi:hypothetical protein